MIKAVFFDIDGTLVSFKTHQVPQSAIKALEELRKKNIKTFIATGRPFGKIDNLGNLKFDAYITMNGSYCMTENKEIIYKNSILQEDIRSLINYQLGDRSFPCMASTENEVYINYEDDNVRHILTLIDFEAPLVKNLDDLANTEIFQLMGFFSQDEEKEIMKKVLPHCETTRWNPLFTDIIAKGNSKQVGMDKILEYYGIDISECIAFGDGGNDIPMLRHAGLSIAMDNADDEVKQHASYVTDSVDNDGIWNALKHFNII